MKKVHTLIWLLAAAILPQLAQAAEPDLSQYTLIKTLDFTTAAYPANTDITLATTQQGTAYDPGNKLQQKIYDVATPDGLAGYLAFQATYVNGKGKGWWIRSTKGGMYCINAGRSAAVLNLKKDYVVKFTCSTDASTVLSLVNADSEPDGPFTYEASEDGKAYYCTMTGDGQVGFYGNKNKGYITSIAIYAPGKVVVKPTGRYTAVDGAKRTVTFSGTSLAWNTDGGDSYTATGKDEWSVTVDKNTTYYVVSTNGEEKSEPLKFDIEAGEEISLAQPAVKVTAIAPGFAKTFSVTCDNSNVLLSPKATISYTFKGADGATSERQEAEGGVISATEQGTYTVYAEAAGYAATTAAIDNTKELELAKTIDFTALAAADLPANWKLLNAQTTVPGSSSQWPAYFPDVTTDEYYYDYTAESASATDVIPGLSMEVTESGKTPKLYTGFGLMYPIYQLNADGTDNKSAANTSGNISVADGTADQFAVYSYVNNYSKGGTKTSILAGNENFALYRFSDLLTKVEIYAPKAAAAAEEATINFNDSTHYAMSTKETHDGDIKTETGYSIGSACTLTVTPSNGNTPNRMWNSGGKPQLRVYGGSLLFKAGEGKAVKAIAVSNKKWNEGNKFNGVAAKSGEWTGNATSVLLQVGGNTQINAITVTVGEADGATVTYVPAVTGISEAKGLPNNTAAAITLDSAVMTIHSGTVSALKSYMQDATGAIAVSSKLSKLDAFGQNVAVSGTLNAVVTSNSRGEYTLDVAGNSGDSQLTVAQESATVTPEAITIEKALTSPATYYAKYVNLKNVKFVKGEDEYGYPVYAIEDSEGNSIAFSDSYYQFGYEMPKFDTFASINGFVAYDYYGTQLEFSPYGDYEATYVAATKVASIGDLKNIENGTEVELTLTGAKVTVYQLTQMGMTCYLEDATGAVKVNGETGWMSIDPDATSLINALNITKTGIQFDGSLFCTVNNGYGDLSLSLNASTKNSQVTTTENVTVTPTALTVAQATEQAQRYSMCLVKFTDVKIASNEGELSVVDGDNTIGIYDDFGTFLDDELQPTVPDTSKKYDMTGILLYQGEAYGTLFCPLSYVESVPTGISSAGADSILDGSVWTLNGLKAGTGVKGLKKGVYVINGKKVVVK